MNRISDLLDGNIGKGGFSMMEAGRGRTEEQKKAEFAKVTGAAPAAVVVDEPEFGAEVEAAPEPEPVVEVPEPVRVVEPVIVRDFAAEKAELVAEGLTEKAADLLIERYAKPAEQARQQSAQEIQRSMQAREQAQVDRFIKVYPELKNAAARRAVLATVTVRQGESDTAAYRRALVGVYGNRAQEMRNEVEYQMSAPARGAETPTKVTKDQANIAAIKEFQRTGSHAAAAALKQRLLNS